MSARRLALALLVLSAGLGSCRRGQPARDRSGVDWDWAAFALQLVRREYREQTEGGDFSAIPSLMAVLDGARPLISGRDARATWLDSALLEVRQALSRHDPARSVGRLCAGLTAQLAAHGIPLAVPGTAPNLSRGAAAYQLACAPCHGPPNGPPPPAAARLVPPPPRPTESALTPYELFNRITYGGAGTAMPSFADTLPAAGRWDIAFYLFADRWPPCTTEPEPLLTPAQAAHTTDQDIWKAHGYGAASCLRRKFR